MGGNPTTFAGSDHGFGAAVVCGQRERCLECSDRRRRLTARKQRQCEQLQRRRRCAGGPATAPNPAEDITKACWAGGTIQIYINPNRLNNAGSQPPLAFQLMKRFAQRSAMRSRT